MPKLEYIEKYWAGEPYNEHRSWECLLEGTITFSDYISIFGVGGELFYLNKIAERALIKFHW